MKALILAISLLFASTAGASVVLLEVPQADRNVETVLGQTVGTWTANGVDTPSGFSAWLKASESIGNPNIPLTWSLVNLTTSQTYVPFGASTISRNDWLALPQGDAPAGYKTVQIALLNPPWSAPANGDQVAVTLDGFNTWFVKAPSTWTAQAVTVPEPSAIALLLLAGGIITLFRVRW